MAAAKGRQRAEWSRTAQLSALLANPHRDTKRHPEPFAASDFNPFAEPEAAKPKRRELKMKVSCLKWLCENGELEEGDGGLDSATTPDPRTSIPNP